MTPEKRQRILLVALAVLAAVAGGTYLWPLVAGDGPGRVGGSRTGAAAGAAPVVTPLAVDLLTATPRDYDPGRDPFGYGRPPAPPPPTPEELAAIAAAEQARQAAEAEAKARRKAERQAALEASPPEPPRPRPPAFQLRYLGSFGPAARRIAVFTDGQEIYNAVVGDVIAEQFVVADIGYESVAIRYVAFPDEPLHRVGIGS